MHRVSALVVVLFGVVAAPWHGTAQEATPAATPTAAGPEVPIYRGNPARTGEMPGPGPAGQALQYRPRQLVAGARLGDKKSGCR